MSIIMTGGGTGGHLAIIKAVKERLVSKSLIYVGSTQGQDRSWFERDEQFKQTYFLSTRGVVNQGILGKIKSLWMLAKATVDAYSILKKHNAKVVFCVGGFSAAPTSVAAILARIPLVIHEQNAVMGSLNRRLSKYATAFISSYDTQSPIKSYPIKEEFFSKARVRDKIKSIIFLGGSQGAKAINELAITLAPWLHSQNIKIIHQAGEKNIQSVVEQYEKLGIKAEVFGFTTKMPDIMASADFAIARSGASTLWELSANGLPTIFVPYPFAAGDHQYHNAQFLVEQNLAWVMREKNIDIDEVKNIILNSGDIRTKSRKLLKSIDKDGSQKIASLLTKIATQG
ncbi:MAG: undecaprenyldiphospho-muramoylpentapeptide beta-N-acetylglucosaminyltransferase [Sulfurovaceae bacterium]|nr:undecaprenyldiphospho-muramoylpentapeptide beta-N-acetylglucosaminyltransferase [Sulfurovaceae bacterium]